MDLRDLPEDAQREVYDFYLFVKYRVLEKITLAFLNQSEYEFLKAKIFMPSQRRSIRRKIF